MKQLLLIFQVQCAEYKQNRLLNIGFILSLAIATSTLLSILILNHASKLQYQQANSQLESPVAQYIVPKRGNSVSIKDFARLRKQGFNELQGVLSFRKKLKNNNTVYFKAIDLLPLSIAKPEVYHPTSILLSNTYAKTLKLAVTSKLQLIDQQTLIVKRIESKLWHNVALLDIAYAWQLFPEYTGFSYLIVSEMTEKRLKHLNQSLPENLILQQSFNIKERSGFADALHLNLTALALLGFIVSAFIAYQGANQAWHKRVELMSQLRLLGVALVDIKLALMFEALFLIIISSILGVILAFLMVSFLLPLLGFTLSQLYQLQSSGHFEWNWLYLLWSGIISSLAVFFALFRQFKLINTKKVSLFSKQSRVNLTHTKFIKKLLFFVALTSVVFFIIPEFNWHSIMLKYGVLLIITTALLPLFLYFIFSALNKFISRYKVNFILQDLKNQISIRFLPLAAFYIALTTSIAAALMVSSFESAFIKYLDQHLDEDLYIRFKIGEKEKIEQWLSKNNKVDEFLLYHDAKALVDKDTVTVNTVNSKRQLSSIVFKSQLTQSLEQVLKNGCFINEQLALKRNILLADKISLSQSTSISRTFTCTVSGIYFDYGNPSFEVTIAQKLAKAHLSGLKEIGFGVYFKSFDEKIVADLIEQLNIDESQLYQPSQIKKMALNVFKETFLLTQGIAVVLLSIACFGLFLSANNLELARKSDLFILISLGYSKSALFIHMLIQWLLLACGCILLSWPIATILADVLVSKVLPSSFGWSMPLLLETSSFISSSIIGLICLIPALTIVLSKINLKGRL